MENRNGIKIAKTHKNGIKPGSKIVEFFAGKCLIFKCVPCLIININTRMISRQKCIHYRWNWLPWPRVDLEIANLLPQYWQGVSPDA